MSRELLKRALGALELINHRGNTDDELFQVGQVAMEIRAELEKPEQPCKRCAAYKTIVKSLEARLKHYSENESEYKAAIASLDSERVANEILTNELEKPEPVECGRVEVIKGYPFGLRALRIFPDGKYRLLAEKLNDE